MKLASASNYFNHGYLPHKSVYGLDTISAECKRIRLYQRRKKAVEKLNAHLHLPSVSIYL